MNVTITEEGTYRGACAEFCGLLHAHMDFRVRTVPSDEFEAWLSQQAAS
jgi:cytochrome c oxidase subunit 2